MLCSTENMELQGEDDEEHPEACECWRSTCAKILGPKNQEKMKRRKAGVLHEENEGQGKA